MSEQAFRDLELLLRAIESLPGRPTASRQLAGVADAIRAARVRGVEWAEIVEGLARAGITRPDGRPLPRSTVASVMRRLDKQPHAPAAKLPQAEAMTAVKEAKPAPKPRPPASAGEFILPPEVEAFLNDVEPENAACEIDNLLKGLNNGKA